MQSNGTQILINGVSAQDGGGITFINSLVGSLAKFKADIQYIVFVSSGVFSEFGEIGSLANVEIVSVNQGQHSLLRRLWWEQITLPKWSKRQGTVLLISPGNVCCFRWRGPQIVIIQSIAPFRKEAQEGKGIRSRLRYLALNLFTRISFRVANVVIVNSEISRSIVLENSCSPDRIRIIPIGRSEIFSQCSMNELNLNSFEGKYILTVGTVSRHKNLETLIMAFSELKKRGRNWPLKIVGSIADERYYDYLKSLAQDLGLTSLIEFLGHIPHDQLPNVYQKAGVFVLTSKIEGFSIPLVEAISMGCPVVSPKQITTQEVCCGAALECDAYNASDVAQKIEQVMTDSELRARMRASGLARANELDWSRLAGEYLVLFKQLAGRSS